MSRDRAALVLLLLSCLCSGWPVLMLALIGAAGVLTGIKKTASRAVTKRKDCPHED